MSLPLARPFTPPPEDDLEPQVVLVLVGLVGSGKTTLSRALEAASSTCAWHASPASSSPPDSGGTGGSAIERGAEKKTTTTTPMTTRATRKRKRRWVRASQDDAPSRRRQECEAVVRAALEAGHNVVVDRVDFDSSQRAHFVSLAYAQHPRPQVYALVLPVRRSTLLARLAARTGHPTLPDAETAQRVLGEMEGVFSPPLPGGEEGFDRVFELGEEAQPPGGLWAVEEPQTRTDAHAEVGQAGRQWQRPPRGGGYARPAWIDRVPAGPHAPRSCPPPYAPPSARPPYFRPPSARPPAGPRAYSPRPYGPLGGPYARRGGPAPRPARDARPMARLVNAHPAARDSTSREQPAP
ncbi:hypothetical protein Q5752_000728 [Cryptotrichosporon argae]